MNVPRSNVASWGEAGRQAGKNFAQIAETTRKYSPQYDELAKLGIQARAKEKESAIVAERKVRVAEIKAEKSLEKTDIEIDSKLAAYKSKRKAGMVAAAGSAIGLGLMKDTETPPATKAIDYSATEQYFANRTKRLDEQEAALGKPTEVASADTPVAAKQKGTTDYTFTPGNTSLNIQGLQALAEGAGFKGEDARTMAAIAMAESSGNPKAHNPNASTGDNSYGLFQINMLGGMGPERRKQFGIESNEQLFNPATNARAAKQVYDSGQGFGAWSVYNSGKYKEFLK
jgi:soluble lytic murein transglycosylase-like protein